MSQLVTERKFDSEYIAEVMRLDRIRCQQQRKRAPMFIVTVFSNYWKSQGHEPREFFRGHDEPANGSWCKNPEFAKIFINLKDACEFAKKQTAKLGQYDDYEYTVVHVDHVPAYGYDPAKWEAHVAERKAYFFGE